MKIETKKGAVEDKQPRLFSLYALQMWAIEVFTGYIRLVMIA
jgi:hypothetical protein